ncbi:uncharacterized protein LOC126407154 [Epinephelus moara]|uniref:uncharacterized protein LOC126407154 n=1 Tax=Epinephelus moara TaxID=300413 RepID=UPI00214E147B|nr:uncharacterized protein LOC126407154 [Epinephelus moara]
MAVNLRVLLILCGLTGINSITTVSKVSVKAGASVIIPCLYDKQYTNHVKGLCKGFYWDFCSYVVKTNQRNSGKFSVSEDKSQRIFNVTIKGLTADDTNYWCAVEKDGGPDARAYFHLSVTRGTPSLYVAQQVITGFIGDDITINCHYQNSAVIKWCRLGGSCVTMTSGSFYGARVTIIRMIPNAFTVTMSRLSTKSSGWYLCVKGDLQMPVHLTVTVKPTTTTLATTQRFSTLSSTPNLIPDIGDRSFISLLIPLCLLILIVLVALFIWFLLKRHKQTQAESSATRMADEVTYTTVQHKSKTSSQAEEEVAYANIGFKRKPLGQSYAENDVDVMYSSVVTLKQKPGKRVEAEDKDCAGSCYFVLTHNDMAVHLLFLLLLTRLTGVHSVTTVSKVSVKAGASISIPCLYDSQFINNVKYLCGGYYWDFCSHVVQTNQRNSGKFSISDDKSQNIFTVTIKDLVDKDKNYWCIVEVNGGSDVGEYFQLSVTKGTPSLYVDNQTITGFKGGKITISCHYRNSGETKWCRLGGSCVTSPSGSIDETTVTINASVHDVFTVTMSGLSAQSSGWYLCVSGDLQMPVLVTVDKQPTTNVPPTTVQHRESPPDHLKIFSVRLAVLIFVVMVTSFTLFMFKRHKPTNKESSATTTVKYEAEEEATYSNTEHMAKTSRERSHVESEVEQ